jgi:hypothetical protein
MAAKCHTIFYDEKVSESIVPSGKTSALSCQRQFAEGDEARFQAEESGNCRSTEAYPIPNFFILYSNAL